LDAQPHVHLAKTKFVLHAGLAFGAFHRYIYEPFRSGAFTSPLHHGLSAGRLDSSAINTANTTVSSIGSRSAHSGATIRELAPSNLGR